MLLALCLMVQSAVPAAELHHTPRPGKVNQTLLLSGTAAFAASYLASVSVGVLSEVIAGSLPVVPAQHSSLNGLFIPVAGPFIAMANVRNRDPGATLILAADGVVQLAAVTMIVVGLVLPHEPSRVTIAPGVSGSGLGATLMLNW
jgi:hypothetical protein